jgi:lactoylglutathione lyase
MTQEKLIEGLYETHLEVSDLERSVTFYEGLGLTLGQKHVKGAFFWVTEPGGQMLALWLTGEGRAVQKRSFGFQTAPERILRADEWLQERGIQPIAQFGREPVEPIVHPWMPAAAVYFTDPDGNNLKLLAMLPGKPVPMPGVLYHSEWLKLSGSAN